MGILTLSPQNMPRQYLTETISFNRTYRSKSQNGTIEKALSCLFFLLSDLFLKSTIFM